jgi:hypothetical protein
MSLVTALFSATAESRGQSQRKHCSTYLHDHGEEMGVLTASMRDGRDDHAHGSSSLPLLLL